MNIQITSYADIVKYIQEDGSDLWSGLTSGVESAASWLFTGSQATSTQLADFGNRLLDRAADLSNRLSSLAEGVGTATERAALQESAQRINDYIASTRAGGTEALANAGATAATAARQAAVAAGARIAGPAVDGYQYASNLADAIESGNWTEFGGTAAGIGASAAMGAVGHAAAIAAIAALATVVAVPAGAAVAIIFATAAAGAYLGAVLGPTIFDGWQGIADFVTDFFVGGARIRPPVSRDPLAIDLDGDGIETVGSGTNPVLFDHNDDGIRTGSGWVRPDDAWLALDRNGNGLIDSGRELFGVDTVLSGTPSVDAVYAATGFEALRTLDANADNLFDAQDTAFAQVRLWQDINQDGVSQASELFTLADKGIASISLNAVTTNINLGNGNTISGTATVTRSNGSTTQVDAVGVAADTTAANLELSSNPFYREFTTPVPLSSTAQELPEMRGSGWVRDLREAMSLGTPQAEALAGKVQEFSNATTRDAQRALLDDVLRLWAETNQTQATAAVDDPLRRFVLNGDATASARLQWAIPILEVFNGMNVGNAGMQAPSSSVNGDGQTVLTYSLFANQAPVMLNAYDALKDSVYSALVTQTRLQPYLDAIELVIDENGVHFDTATLSAQLGARRASDERNAIFDLADLNRFAQPAFVAAGYDGIGTLRNWIDALPLGSPIRAELVGADVFNGSASAGTGRPDIYFGDAAGNNFSAGAGNDVLDGGLGNDALYGGDGADTLRGGDGGDVMLGGAGNDLLDGGAGNDDVRGEAGNNTFLFGRGDGSDTIRSFTDATPGRLNTLQFKAGIAPSDLQLSTNGDSLIVRLAGGPEYINIENFRWSDDPNNIHNPVQRFVFDDGTSWDVAAILNHLFAGTATGEVIAGTANADVISGQDGGDYLYGQGGNDVLDGGLGSDGVYGGDGADTLRGGDGGDVMLGGAGNDLLDGGAGNDDVRGEAGNNTFLFGRGDGSDTIRSFTDATPGRLNTLQFKAGIAPSDLQLSTNGDSLIVRLAGGPEYINIENFRWSDDPNNIHNPVQRFVFDDGTSWDLNQIAAVMRAVTQQGSAAGDALTGGVASDSLVGLDGNDTIVGNAGHDLLDGGLGVDSMSGNVGDDVYVVDNVADLVTEALGEGVDSVRSSVDWTLGANVEHLVLTGVAAVNGTGNALNNEVYGNSAANSLSGGGGDDRYFVSTGDTVTEDADAGIDTVFASSTWSLGANIEQLTLTGSAIINGTGNSLANVLIGNDAANALNGGAGADVMTGGLGDDAYTVDDAGDVVSEFARQGTDSIDSSIAYTLGANVENLTLTGSGANAGTGNELDNLLTGNSGANTLTGGAGNDTLDGGSGTDTLVGGARDDVYRFTGSFGSDTLYEAIGTGESNVVHLADRLPSQVYVTRDGSSLQLVDSGTGDRITLSGTWADNGNPTADLALGQWRITFADGSEWDESDVLAAADFLRVSSHADVVYGTSGNDAVDAGLGDDVMRGNAGDDVLHGGDGADSVSDSLGRNVLDGGAGADVLGASGGASVFIGGLGDDELSAYADGSSTAGPLILVRAGDGHDSISWGSNDSTTATVSVGGVADESQLTLSADGTSIELNFAGAVQLTLRSQLSGEATRPANLQVIEQDSIRTYDLAAVLADFRAAVQSNPTLETWNAAASLQAHSLGTSTNMAIGGSLAYRHAIDGSLASLPDASIQTLLQDASFGVAAQSVSSGSSNALQGTEDPDMLVGDSGDNVLYGYGGDDTMYGGEGADTMYGGATGDVYFVDNAGDVIVEYADGGSDDMVVSFVSTTLADNVENMFLTGDPGLVGTGNALDNMLMNDDADSTLVGMGGNDTYLGGGGDDALIDSSEESDDVYHWGIDQGHDTITDAGGSADRIEIGEGVSSSDVLLSRVGDNLELSILGATDTLTVVDYYANLSNRVEQIRLADGSTIDTEFSAPMSLSGDAELSVTLQAGMEFMEFLQIGGLQLSEPSSPSTSGTDVYELSRDTWLLTQAMAQFGAGRVGPESSVVPSRAHHWISADLASPL